MRALLSEAPGGPDTLQLRDVVAPTPVPGELLVRVRACAINFPDVLIIEDKYQLRPQRPFAPGGEIAGEVIGVGEGVSGWTVGDRIIAALGFGGLAEQVIVPADRAIRLPPERSFEEGSALLMTYATAIHALVDRGRLRAGQILLVLGAAGGVGLAAVEIGKALGARVVAAVSSEAKAEAACEAGADDALIYPAGETDPRALSQLFKDAVGPSAADVILDPVGGPYTEAALRSIAWEGRFLVVGFPAGIAKLPLNLTLLKSCDVCGVFWGGIRGARSQGQRRPHRAAVPLVGRGQDRAKDQRDLSAGAGRRGDRRIARPQSGRKTRGDNLKVSAWQGSRTVRTIFWAAVAFSFVMAVLPQPPEIPGEPNDKVQHMAAFATMALLGAFAFPGLRLLRLLVGLSLFGAFIELLQAIPELHRDSELLDWVADTVAASIFLLLVFALRRVRR